jgi:hypothetical protein
MQSVANAALATTGSPSEIAEMRCSLPPAINAMRPAALGCVPLEFRLPTLDRFAADDES